MVDRHTGEDDDDTGRRGDEVDAFGFAVSARIQQGGPWKKRHDNFQDFSVLVFDLKTESEWGKPGQPTALPDLPDHLGPCMRAPRPHSDRVFHADPILRTPDTCFSVT